MNIMIIGKGRMGKLIAETAARRENMNVILMADRLTHPDLSDFDGDTDVVIDFSHRIILTGLQIILKRKNVPMCAAQPDIQIHRASRSAPCPHSFLLFFSQTFHWASPCSKKFLSSLHQYLKMILILKSLKSIIIRNRMHRAALRKCFSKH